MGSAATNERLIALFERHYDDVLGYCARRIGRSDADEAAAEVFAVAWRRIDEIEWATVRPWLFGIARGVLANRWRSLHRWSRLNRRVAALAREYGESPEVVVVRRDQDRVVVDALHRLSHIDQEVLRLTAWEELNSAEISQVLGISTAAVDKRRQRALRRLEHLLSPPNGNTRFSPRAANEGGGG
ncbi:MAG TPA: sigma-70 family RNA polymerase sigma factor [Acidimicrobiia bacterium]